MNEFGSGLQDKVGLGEIDFDALHYRVDARDIGDVLSRCPASTASDNAADTPAAIGDNSAGVAWGGKGTGLVVKRKDRLLHREIRSAVFVVVTDAGTDVVGTADSQAGGIAVLGHHKAGFPILV